MADKVRHDCYKCDHFKPIRLNSEYGYKGWIMGCELWDAENWKCQFKNKENDYGYDG